MSERRSAAALTLRIAASAAVVVATGFFATGTPPAAAETAAEVRELARRADTDPAALNRLRGVTEVDGQPADFEQALEGAEGEELSHRLDVIESSAGTPRDGRPIVVTEGAQREARRILDTPRYKPDEPPRPFAGAIRRLGEWLEPVITPLGAAFSVIERALASIFEDPWKVALVAVLVVVLAALLTGRSVGRRSRLAVYGAVGPGGGASTGDPRDLDPRDLERQADAAEAAGDLDRAFRLRFLAGVLRLDRAGVIEYRPSATTGELVRTVRSTTFRPLARTFDEVAYGGRQPQPDDIARAKSEWPRVLEEARR